MGEFRSLTLSSKIFVVVILFAGVAMADALGRSLFHAALIDGSFFERNSKNDPSVQYRYFVKGADGSFIGYTDFNVLDAQGCINATKGTACGSVTFLKNSKFTELYNKHEVLDEPVTITIK